MRPPFGTLKATLSKTIIANAPRYTKIVEPFADGGTFALTLGKRKAREHIVNIENPELFAAFQFAQAVKGPDKKRLKSFDWVASQETFDDVLRITATEGADAFYRFFYLKKFGTRMEPDDPVIFDKFRVGKDAFPALYGLPLMTVGLKGVTLINDDPLQAMKQGGGAFSILLPMMGEHIEAVKSKLPSWPGDFFYAAKMMDNWAIAELAATMPGGLPVTALPVASPGVKAFAVITNYETKLAVIDSTADDLGLGPKAMAQPIAEARCPKCDKLLAKNVLAADLWCERCKKEVSVVG